MGKKLFIWPSLVMSLMVSFRAIRAILFFPRDVLDEISDLIYSVSENFLITSDANPFRLVPSIVVFCVAVHYFRKLYISVCKLFIYC